MSRYFYLKRPKSASPVRPYVRPYLRLEHAIRAKRVVHLVTGELIAYIIRHPQGGWYLFDENDKLIFPHQFEEYFNAFQWLRRQNGCLKPTRSQEGRAMEALESCTDATHLRAMRRA